MKKYTLKVEMELTPAQAEHWNDCLSFLKTSLSAGPKVARKDFQQPPLEFVEKILSIMPLEVRRKGVNSEVKLFESSNPSEFWVSPFSVKELLLREK